MTIQKSVEKAQYTPGQLKVSQKDGDFTWAIAVTSRSDSNNQTAEDFLSYGNFSLQYKITGGDEDGKVYEITLSPCGDLSEFEGHYDEGKD